MNTTLNNNQTSQILAPEPPCHIFVSEGAVSSITCPKFDDNPNRTTSAIPQQDALFAVLRYLLPRLEATLFYNPDGYINELESYGNVKMHRNLTMNDTDEYGHNVTRIKNNYKQADFDEYWGRKPKNRKISYDTLIDAEKQEVSFMQFQNTWEMVDFSSILMWNSHRFTLRIMDSYPVTQTELNNLYNEIYVESAVNDYVLITYPFTFDEWRGIDPTLDKEEETDPLHGRNSDDFKAEYQSKQTNESTIVDTEEETRRRLVYKEIADVILALFDDKEHFLEIYRFEVHWLQVIQGFVRGVASALDGDFAKVIDPNTYRGIPEKLELFAGITIDIYHNVGLAIGWNWEEKRTNKKGKVKGKSKSSFTKKKNKTPTKKPTTSQPTTSRAGAKVKEEAKKKLNDAKTTFTDSVKDAPDALLNAALSGIVLI